MIVVVSAIVDPWVTTLSFVVALAMRIQDEKRPVFFKTGPCSSEKLIFQARFKDLVVQKSLARSFLLLQVPG